MTPSAWVKAMLLFAVVLGGTLVVGVDLEHCLLLAVGTVVVVQLRRLPAVEEEGWPRRYADPSDRGVRREVARLSWGLSGFESRVERRSVDRLHAIAARRLRATGIELDDPADADRVREVLGTEPYATLTLQPHTPRYDAFARAVAAVERLPVPPT